MQVKKISLAGSLVAIGGALGYLFFATPGIAQNDPPPDGGYTLRLCNRTGLPTISVAQLYYSIPDGDWIVEGWWNIKNGECRSLSRAMGQFATLSTGYHAFGGQLTWWLANRVDVNHCVVKGTTFKRRLTPVRPCATGETLVGFRRIQIKKGETVTRDIKS